MPVEKFDLDIDVEYDLFGIITSEKESKLAWAIETKLGLELNKNEEIVIDFLKGNQITISNFSTNADFGDIYLFKNKAVDYKGKNSFLVPELKQFEYLLKLDGAYMDRSDEIFEELSKGLLSIHYITRVDVNQLKSKDNLLF